ncbi:hypothetical protein KCP73_17930 [Salmonella enterica subsp. enterica]|nr:hypothetical protein KCP73_17930 [Salmonella enterica subsp. enterica]
MLRCRFAPAETRKRGDVRWTPAVYPRRGVPGTVNAAGSPPGVGLSPLAREHHCGRLLRNNLISVYTLARGDTPPTRRVVATDGLSHFGAGTPYRQPFGGKFGNSVYPRWRAGVSHCRVVVVICQFIRWRGT